MIGKSTNFSCKFSWSGLRRFPASLKKKSAPTQIFLPKKGAGRTKCVYLYHARLVHTRSYASNEALTFGATYKCTRLGNNKKLGLALNELRLLFMTVIKHIYILCAMKMFTLAALVYLL
jgi:hypothetical protein